MKSKFAPGCKTLPPKAAQPPPQGAPGGLTCFGGNKKACPHSAPHPVDGERCCTHYGNLRTDGVFKLDQCREAFGLPEVTKRW